MCLLQPLKAWWAITLPPEILEQIPHMRLHSLTLAPLAIVRNLALSRRLPATRNLACRETQCRRTRRRRPRRPHHPHRHAPLNLRRHQRRRQRHLRREWRQQRGRTRRHGRLRSNLLVNLLPHAPRSLVPQPLLLGPRRSRLAGALRAPPEHAAAEAQERGRRGDRCGNDHERGLCERGHGLGLDPEGVVGGAREDDRVGDAGDAGGHGEQADAEDAEDEGLFAGRELGAVQGGGGEEEDGEVDEDVEGGRGAHDGGHGEAGAGDGGGVRVPDLVAWGALEDAGEEDDGVEDD